MPHPVITASYSAFLALAVYSTGAYAKGAPLEGRAEVNWRMGDERSILMTEFWVPFAQNDRSVLYGDLRLMGDNQDNREGNLGVGYRTMTAAPFLGKGIAGVHGWIDRRITERGSTFHQATLGSEWFSHDTDIKLNAYVPLSSGNEVSIPATNPQGAQLSGTGITVDTNGKVFEEPLHGLDLEFGFELSDYVDFAKDHTDSFRVYTGGYYFNGDNTEDIAGWRVRVATDISENIQLGTRFQRDDERGAQGFLEATIRFPFGNKRSFRREGLKARLDESPERDIDIVTGDVVTDTGGRVQVLNAQTGRAQKVITVDNSVAAGGDGSAEAPYNTLLDAQNNAEEGTIIYVRNGLGDSTGQDQGITLDKVGQQLIGSGVDFVYDKNVFKTANGASPTSVLIAPASIAPVIGNINSGEDGITIRADNVRVAGVNIDNAQAGRDGIAVLADGVGESALKTHIHDVVVQNARHGIYVHAANNGAVSAMIERTVMTSNTQHGIAIYDDTNAQFDVDLGGGSLGSGGRNFLYGNGLEDLAVDYDGRTLFAKNNWWGQANGPDIDAPSIGTAPQIYYGAPINDGLVGHWTFDTQWVDATTAYDRSVENNDGVLRGGLSTTDIVDGLANEALDFDGSNDIIDLGPATGASSLNISPAFSVSAWINRQSDGTIFGIRNGNSTQFQYYVHYGTIRARGLSTVVNGHSIPLNTWTHVIASVDSGGNVTFFKDGGSALYRGAIPQSDYNINASLGARYASYPGTAFRLNGQLDDVRLYNKALSASEAAEIFRSDASSQVNFSGYLMSQP